jgi:hypothetical protein
MQLDHGTDREIVRRVVAAPGGRHGPGAGRPKPRKTLETLA